MRISGWGSGVCSSDLAAGVEGGSGDELFDRAVRLVCQERKASTSFIQRHLQIGYNRAARIIEQMEKEGIVSPADHVGRREVLGSGAGELAGSRPGRKHLADRTNRASVKGGEVQLYIRG